MSPVDRAGRFPRSHLTSKSFVKTLMCSYERAGWLGRAGSVTEISVFPTGISVSGLEILPYEHFIPITGRKIIQCIFVIERKLPSF